MTREEYLEFVEESLGFYGSTSRGTLIVEPRQILYDDPKVIKRLNDLHAEYCAMVEHTLFPERNSKWDALKIEVSNFFWRLRERIRYANWQRQAQDED